MVGKIFLTAAAVFAAVNAQSCPIDPALQLPGNPIFTPDGSNTPTIGQPFSVTYDGSGLGTNLRFILYRGPATALVEIGPIADVTNCGTARCAFSWTPAANLQPDTSRYGLRMVDLATCKYQFTTQFGLNAGTTPPASSAAVSAAPSTRPSGSVVPPPKGSSAPPPAPSGGPRPSGPVPPPPTPSDDCDGQPGQGGAPGGYNPPSGGYSYPNNGSYSNGTGGASPTYQPLQSNDGARMAISAFGAIMAFSAAVMAL